MTAMPEPGLQHCLASFKHQNAMVVTPLAEQNCTVAMTYARTAHSHSERPQMPY
jgi:hypothetical protein